MLGFLETLCGPGASDLNVKDKDKYKFDPKKLLSQIASIVHRVWSQECKHSSGTSEGFLVSFGTHPEYSQGVVERWTNVLQRHSLLDPQGQKYHTHFLEEVRGHTSRKLHFLRKFFGPFRENFLCRLVKSAVS